ncbi:MAG: protein-export membrane protein SecD [Acidobacteria bacterium RIFCSPLOWO2_12_FULL_54_10]|nr:MAG: protein-export membrane protein SecD [Acidobacteria bacterium RIFCSPLOWO2_12_FULL_54_10]
MLRNLKKKAILIIAITLVSLYGVIGLPTGWDSLLNNLRDRTRLGLDLQGGTHLVLQVMVNEAINAESDQTVERLRQTLRQKDIDYAAITRIDATELMDDGGITIEGIPSEQTSAFRDMMEIQEINWTYESAGGGTYRLRLRQPALAAIRQQTLDQSLETIRNRVDSLGVSEPTIQERGQGEYEILVQLPGVDDPERVKEIINTTAMLEIKQVSAGPYNSRQDGLAMHGGVLPVGTELIVSVEAPEQATAAPVPEQWYLVNRIPAITGRDLRTARPGRDENNRPQVDFTLNNDGARRFGEFTGANIGNSLAVVLDGRIQSVATIQSQITDSGRITGQFSQQRANDLALVLRAGALPASMRYLEERTVGPSLGADSIRAGVTASLIGLVAVVAFMVIYYKFAGINAIVALTLNLLILMAVLNYIQGTLTLPGIAGILLTIGMAVDANVLVFERIREELRAGKTPVSAIEAGFSKAIITIIDTNTTTIIAAFFLFLFGTGPVKGFAVTVSIGLAANLFAAVFVSRFLFDLILAKRPRQEGLSI